MAIHGAIFLSYASQDAPAARGIAAALRAAGVEVWLDQSELRGGDAWDASIRRKIRECALFVPLISAGTDARPEGYFRLEWKLAVDRSHLMADDQPFLLPVVIDETPEPTARVPDRFRERQWSRLDGGNGLAALTERVTRLLEGTAAPIAAPVATSLPPAQGAPAAGAPSTTPASESPSIAVLPFINMSRDEDNEYFADGLSEELLNVLAKIRGLRVASRTSAFSFKGKEVDIPTVARKLNVATVLEGSVRKSGKRVRITAQLIEVATDSHLWSETYDRELDDIFAVQDDIAQSVVKELRTALLGVQSTAAASAAAAADVRNAATGRSDDPKAYQLYLQGKLFGERVTQASTDRAIHLFGQAIAIDPKFALAWAELSKVHQMQAGFGFAPIVEGCGRAREAARNALALAPDLPEGHIQLGNLQQAYDWDWTAAGASFHRALELAPGDVNAMRACAGLARILGRTDEALALGRKVIELDPLTPATHRGVGTIYFMLGQLDKAAACYQHALDVSPAAGLAHAFLALTRLRQGRGEEALALARAETHDVFRNLALTMIHHEHGRIAESDAALKAMIDGFGWTAAYQIAEAYAHRGETDRAFEWLERAYEQRDSGTAYAAGDVFFRPLHNDPRWQLFVRRMGFAQA
jgi:TolB-like protein/Flp pilus assembly protein TadD